MRRQTLSPLSASKQEFRSLSDITHPNLVNLYELFAVEDRWFFTMELVEGCNFLSYVEEPPRAAARWNAEPTDDRAAAASRRRVEPGAADFNVHFDEKRLREALSQLGRGCQHAAHRQGSCIGTSNRPMCWSRSRSGWSCWISDYGRPRERRRGAASCRDRRPHVAGASCGRVGERGQRLVQRRRDVVRSHDRPASVCGHAGGGAGRQAAAAGPFARYPGRGLPHDLVRLCVALSGPRLRKRPGGRDVIARSRAAPEPLDQSEPARAFPLIGRSRHRQVLDGGLAALHRRKTVSLFVFGRTGTGKTTLVRSFLDELLEREEAVVLSGRCYERESVPYKALDSLIDSLARYLKGLPPEQTRVSAAGRRFPGPRVSRAAEPRGDSRPRGVSPEECPTSRSCGGATFAGLRELLKRLAERTPLILAIDDLQWGDVDSAHLLCRSDLLGPFAGPAFHRLLSLRGFRAKPVPARDAELDGERAQGAPITASWPSRSFPWPRRGNSRWRFSGETTPSRSRRTWSRPNQAETLFSSTSWCDISRAESRSTRWEAIGKLDLDEVLWTRIKRQPEDALRLLGLVAVSGRPISQNLAFQASDLGAGERVALASLRSARLIRCLGQAHKRRSRSITTGFAKRSSPTCRTNPFRWSHERLALVLWDRIGRPGDPGSTLSRHRSDRSGMRVLFLGGRPGRGGVAFDRSARLFRFALELHGALSQAGALWRKLGDALANAGRGNEAAPRLREGRRNRDGARDARAQAPGVDAASSLRRSRRRASAVRTLLRPLGLSMPQTARQARLSLFWHRLLLKLRGSSYATRRKPGLGDGAVAGSIFAGRPWRGFRCREPIRGADSRPAGSCWPFGPASR